MNRQSQVALITGASSGIGLACAQRLQKRGYAVYGTSRRAPAPGAVAEGDGNELVRPSDQHQGSLTIIQMDVHDEESIRLAVDYIMSREGRIDVLVNNAGMGYAGAFEETSLEEAQAQLETNFFGVLRVCQAVLPVMRHQGGGKIISMSSLGGLVGLPFQSMYSASKFALEGAMEALRLEVAPFGIHVSLIEPGNFRTDFTDQRQLAAPNGSDGPYATQFRRALEVIEADERNGAEPERVAETLEKILRSRKPRLRYPSARFPESLLPIAKRFLPDSLIGFYLRTMHRLDS